MRRITLLIGLGLLLTASAAMAQDLYEYFRSYDFGGGLNTATSPFLLKDNEAADILNLNITQEGSAESRGGFVRVGAAAENELVLSLFRYYKDMTAIGEWVMHVTADDADNSRIVELNEATGTVEELFYFDSKRDHTTGKFNFVNFLGRLYASNSTDGLVWYDDPAGTGEVSTAPKCRYLTVHGQRLYMAGNPAEPYTFYFSGLRDGTVWDDVSLAGVNAGYWQLPSSTGGSITGFANWQGYLLIFTESSIWALQGDYPEESSVVELVAGIGCSNPRSIVEMDGEVFFKAGTRIYKMGLPPVDVSKKIYGTIDPGNAGIAVGYERRYWYHNVSGEHSSDALHAAPILVYDNTYDRWTKYDNIDLHAAAVSSAARDQQGTMIALSDTSAVYLYDESKPYDAWGSYDTKWQTRIFHLGTPELNKRFRHFQLDIFGSDARFLVDYSLDYGRVTHREQIEPPTAGGRLDFFILDTDTLGGQRDAIVKFPFHTDMTGKNIQLTFSTFGSATNEYIRLYGFILRYRSKPFRGGPF